MFFRKPQLQLQVWGGARPCVATPYLLPRALVLTKPNPTLTLLVLHRVCASLGGLGRMIDLTGLSNDRLPFSVGLQGLHARP